MKYNYYAYRLANVPIGENDNKIQQVLLAGSLSLLCTLYFDTDEISDTYNHWICSLELISDTEDVPERSITLYPNTIHFDGDVLYTVAIQSSLESIGHDDLQNVFLTIGVPADE